MDHSSHFALNWYEQQKKKREDQYTKNQLTLLNRNLQNVLGRIQHLIEKEKYEVQVRHIESKLVSSGIWNLHYLNNFESGEVALEQGVLLTLILHCEQGIDNGTYLKREVERYMHQLAHFDNRLYGEYNRRKQLLHSLNKEKDKLERVY